MHKKLLLVPAGLVLFASTVLAQSSAFLFRGAHFSGRRVRAEITRDKEGIAHIQAENDHDLFFAQGFVHAQDRLFQMDVTRRTASGTLAELLGPGSLGSDVMFRQLGLRRAAVRSLPLLSRRTQAALQAYAEGVNAYVASHPLPPEYKALELSKFQPWTPIDSMSVSKFVSFSESFDFLDVELTVALISYRLTGGVVGFNGDNLFNDVFRSAPFENASTIPDASMPPASMIMEGDLPVSPLRSKAPASAPGYGAAVPESQLNQAMSVGQQFLDAVKKIPELQRLLDRNRRGGSNEWAVSGTHSTSGAPLLANDPHLPLLTPSTFYPLELHSPRLDVAGASFAGAPGIVTGHNKNASWGATLDPMDVTDYYFEVVVPDPTSPSGLSTVYRNQLEHVISIPETYKINNTGDGILNDLTVVPPGNGVPAATLIVPRRNNGPLLGSGAGLGLSIEYTGFSGTREPDAILGWDAAHNMHEFMDALKFMDVGSFNIAYSDVDGNIAYFTVGDMPIREDLQAGTVNGLPPFFIRSGTGGNEWLPVMHAQPGQAVSYEILPFAEMPHIINPPAGWFVNANNDPVGTTLDNNPLNQLRPGGGIYYLNPGYDLGLRAARITEMIRRAISHGGKISVQTMRRIQADTTLKDAEFFVPYILQASQNAKLPNANPLLMALASDPGVSNAVARLQSWDFTTPVGIEEGYDAAFKGKKRPPLAPPSDQEIATSVAATIYSVWRGQFIRNSIDVPLQLLNVPTPPDQQALTALRHALENFSTQQGAGTSGIGFFNVPGVTNASDRRDIVVLFSLFSALQRLAGQPFAAAFHNSSNQNDYRWGKLHRIVFKHAIGGDFNIPPAFGAFTAPLPGLEGIPRDGGFGTVDAATHDGRAQSVDDFMFDSGPANRFVSEALPEGVKAVTSLPGGVSGIIGSPNSINLLKGWLTNQAFTLEFDRDHDHGRDDHDSDHAAMGER
ncbi:MAG TPA: penicillin acylase family protein [Terriglobales bacterium]|jgi:penicillin amidase|nr:penicillin acylase family protein [Terriglobales bacterium]